MWRERALPDPGLGEIACWALIAGALGYVALERLGTQASVIAAVLAAMGTKAALLSMG